MLNIAYAQLNPTIGDFVGNVALMMENMRRAHADGADLLVFSELSLCGYYPGDMLEDRDFLTRLDAALDRMLAASNELPGIVTAIGTVRLRNRPGKPLHNALLALRDGAIVAEYYKQLLPTYGIFDERRHFEPGPEGACILDIAGKRAQRHELFLAASRHVRMPLLYVNQVGGQDQLVFDGASFAVSPEQGVAFEAARLCVRMA